MLITIILKPNKKDFTTVNAWRLISLLTYLGKGFKRLVIRRIGVFVV